MDQQHSSDSEPTGRPFRTVAAGDLLGRLGGTEWDPENNYESPTARMIREVEDEAAAPGEALAEEMRELFAAADARDVSIDAIAERLQAAIAAYDEVRKERHGQDD